MSHYPTQECRSLFVSPECAVLWLRPLNPFPRPSWTFSLVCFLSFALGLLGHIIEDTPLVDSMSGDKPCYNPDGTLSEDDVPCTSEQNTHCCGKSSICLSNGYCLGADAQPFGLSRGSCTNQNWATGCPQRCWSMDSLPVSFIRVSKFVNWLTIIKRIWKWQQEWRLPDYQHRL